MKKSIKLSTIFACVIMFLVSLLLSVSLYVTPAKAEGGSVFEMEYGASVKINGDGLRFKVKMDQGYYDMITTNDRSNKVELWGYIAPVEEFDKVNGSYKDLAVKVGGKLDENKIYLKDGYYYANIAITDLAQFQKDGKPLYDRPFSAIMFIKDNNTGTYTYAEFAKGEDGVSDINNQIRTQYQVVNAAFLDDTMEYCVEVWDRYRDWFAEEEHPVIIRTVKEYEALVHNTRKDDGALTDRFDENDSYIFIEKTVRDITSGYEGDANLNNAIFYVSVLPNPGHIVSYYDGYRLIEQCFVENGKNAPVPENPTKDGYVFSGWSGNVTSVTETRKVYAKWKAEKGDVKDLGDMSVYGVTLGNGSINSPSDIFGKRVVLSSGSLGDGAYYPADGNPTDSANTADQAYIAYDGNYGFNDYFVADFTGKNMPMLAFFANNYDKSVFYGNGSKNGVVVSTGFTWPDGRLFTQDSVSFSTSVFNGQGLCMWGPHMIYNTAKNDSSSKNVLLHSSLENVALGRANLVDDKQYRIIIGMQPGDDPSNKAIKLSYLLYDLDKGKVVEIREVNTYNFFADGWANAGQTRDQFCQGSIVAYGYFGTPTILDKTYPIYEDTTIDNIVNALGMDLTPTTLYKSTFSNESIVLEKGAIGDGAGYTKGQQGGGYVDQAYYALDGNYNLNDYVAFDFTGKNMPEVAFFAKNYNHSMYAEGTSKQGIVVVTGITTYDGQLSSGVNGNGTKINYGYPYMIQDAADGGFCEGSHAPSALGRANLVDGTHYRVIMGFTGSGSKLTLNWCLYNLDTNEVVEQSSMTTWGFFSGSNAQVGNMTINDLSGSIVLYGKFGATCTIDKLHGVFTDTDIASVADELSKQDPEIECNLSFYNYDGTLLHQEIVYSGQVPVYNGETPVRYGDVICSSYEFAGWDKELTAVFADTSYTATFVGTLRDDVTISGNQGYTYGVEQNGEKIILKKSNLGNSANYTKGQQNAEGAFVHQSYIALDGNYNLNDYVAFDFTGKNLPEIAFFAKNYNDSMYAEGTSKQGIVVVTGITTWDGQLGSGVNGDGTKINYGYPYMIQDAADGGFCEGALKNSQLGRANLVDGTHYRVIMGFTGSGNAITLHWYLYNLDTSTVVEQSTMKTWNFFTGSNAKVGNMTINDLSGSIVLYGKFGTTCTIDKLHGVFMDTDIGTVAAGLNGSATYTVTFQDFDGTVLQQESVAYGTMATYKGATPEKAEGLAFTYTFAGWDKAFALVTGDTTYTACYDATQKDIVTLNNVSVNGDSIVLEKGNLGDGANYTKGQNNGGYVRQSYLALDGNYNLNDYVAFDFTGKNLPEIAFFAKNYNDSMYAEGTSKQGIVVVTGITTWDGQLSSGVNGNGTQINYGFPYMIQDAANGGFCDGALKNSQLGRANLVDGTHYRVIMGFTGSGNAITLHWYLYNLDTSTVVEQSTMKTWNFFTGSNAQVGNMTINDLSGSIVLYGKFGTTCTIDKLHGVFMDTDIATVATGLNGSATYTVTFQDSDGTVLQQESVAYGTMATYNGATPEKAEDLVFTYTFAGWDKALALVTGDTTYTACYDATQKDGVKVNNVSVNGDSLTLNSSSIGDSAHYSGSNYLSSPQVIGTVSQSYYAFDGNYGFNDYVAFDFTGKNMPSVAFFANNYNESMYYQNGDKYGLVVLTGLTTWQGALYTEYNDSKSVWDGKGLLVGGPQMLHNTLNSGKNGVLGFQGVVSNSGSNNNVALGRANLDDSKQYRVIMGMEAGGSSAVRIVYKLYNLTDNVLVETFEAMTYNFFTTGFAKEGQTREEYCQGSIVLYGHFGTTTTLDNVWGIYEDTTLADVAEQLLPPASSVEPSTGVPDYSKYNDQFDFYAYSAYSDGTYTIDGENYYVGMNLANLKQYSMYGQAGLTIYFPQNDVLLDGSASSLNNAKRLLDDLAKVGIHKTILQDSRILYLSMKETAIVGTDCQFADEAALDEYIYNCVKDYATYPGVYGIQLGDEPKYACLSAYAAVYKSIKRVNEKYGFNLFIQYNLNPLNVTENVYDNYYPAVSGTYEWDNYRYTLGWRDIFTDAMTRYQAYIRGFLDAMQPDSIMYDDYPLHMDKNNNYVILDSFIPCLQFVAKEASNRGIAFYMVTQAHQNNASGTEHKRAMTEAGAEWLNNILLGFGTKQIAYYTYYTRSESDLTGGESYVDGESFVDYNGNPTDLYYIMQKIMANDQKFAPTIMQFEYQGSRYYKGSSVKSNNNHVSEITVSDSFTKLSNFSVNKEHALVTELYDDENNNYMYMAMNIVDPDLTGDYTETMTLTFNGYSNALVYRDGVATPTPLNGNVLSVTAAPGEAVFVIPYN